MKDINSKVKLQFLFFWAYQINVHSSHKNIKQHNLGSCSTDWSNDAENS